MRRDFNGKTVVILGGTGGIGGAIAVAFRECGARVCTHGLKGEYKADIRSSKGLVALFKKILAEQTRIDIVVNAVSAPVVIAPFERKTWKDFKGHLDVQLKAAVETATQVIPVMKKQGGGRIVHILTTYVNGIIPTSTADYITAKYALLGFTRALAKEVGRYNITVNAVSPSFIPTTFNAHIPEKIQDFIIRETPLGRLATLNDVVRAVLFLASEDASYITGEDIQISGGSHR